MTFEKLEKTIFLIEVRKIRSNSELEKHRNTPSGIHFPDLRRAVEAPRQDHVAVAIEVETDDLGCVTLQGRDCVPGFHVP